jgi:hypothetical protein
MRNARGGGGLTTAAATTTAPAKKKQQSEKAFISCHHMLDPTPCRPQLQPSEIIHNQMQGFGQDSVD